MHARLVGRSTCWLAYASALLLAYFMATYLENEVQIEGYLIKGLIIDICATFWVFGFSLATGNSSVYDPYWCLAPLFLGFYWKAHAPGGFWFYEPRETIGIVLLWVWSFRFHFGIPWPGWVTGLEHEDWRFEEFQGKVSSRILYWCFSLLSFHLTPTLLVYGALCPLGRIIIQGPQAPPLTLVDLLGASLMAAGIAFEAVADEQLRRFRCAAEPPTTSLHTGLWRWSRHPNYFGECLFWTGLLVLAIGAGAVQGEPRLILGPIVMWVFFRAASVPMMDQRNRDRRPDYALIEATTSALLPWPPAQPRRLD